MHGSPEREPSPWIDLKISVMNIKHCGWKFFPYSEVLAFFPDRRDNQ